jgi:hypothetical protein
MIKTLIGKDGYLFLINDSNKELDIHVNGYTIVNEDSFKKYEKYLDKFLIFIYPDKSYHLKKFLPDNINSQYRPGYLLYKEYFKDKIFDFTDILKHTEEEPFYKTDTHINFLGGYYSNYYFIEQINIFLNMNIKFKKLDINKKNICLLDLELGIGDLLFKENIGDLVIDNTVDTYYYNDDIPYFYTKYLIDNNEKMIYDNTKIFFIKVENNNVVDYTTQLVGNYADWDIISKYIIFVENENIKNNNKILIFYDSFLLHSIQLYFNLFKYTFFSKTCFSHQIIETLKPDYIFEFRVERFLN